MLPISQGEQVFASAMRSRSRSKVLFLPEEAVVIFRL